MELSKYQNIQVKEYDINSEVSYTLLQELSEKLQRITGSSGEANFNKKDVEGDKSLFVVATLENEPIGCGSIREIDSYTAEVKRMYARYSGIGIGGMILNYLSKQAKIFGYTALLCETRKINTVAVAFYLKSGFKRIENYGIYKGRDDAVCFQKIL